MIRIRLSGENSCMEAQETPFFQMKDAVPFFFVWGDVWMLDNNRLVRVLQNRAKIRIIVLSRALSS
jgi:hypothetical protein